MRIIITLLCLCILPQNSYAFDLSDALGQVKDVLRDANDIRKEINKISKEPGGASSTNNNKSTSSNKYKSHKKINSSDYEKGRAIWRARKQAYVDRCGPIARKCRAWVKNTYGKRDMLQDMRCMSHNKCSRGQLHKARKALQPKKKAVKVPTF